MVWGRCNSHHIRRLRQITALPGFTGMASVGVALETHETDHTVDGFAGVDIEQSHRNDNADQQQLDLQSQENLQKEQEEEEQLNNDIIDILTISMDHASLAH